MQNTMEEVWKEITVLLAQGLSLIPVRDKDEGEFLAKTPYRSWKQWQTKQITKDQLWYEMTVAHNTNAIAVICGKVSGNLEIIDVDEKYKKGISVRLFKDISELLPSIWEKLRIHQSPSFGHHIPYYILEGTIPGNHDLACRPPTEAEIEKRKKELAENPRLRGNAKPKAFIETRGEGGYALFPPSLGYRVIKDMPIPVLTWEERCQLHSLCQQYDEMPIVEEKVYKATKSEELYYDINPFEHFNRTCDPVSLLENVGWKKERANKHFIWFTRPGKERGTSASFNLSKRVIFVFTSSTEFYSGRGYNPATFLSETEFDGDKRRTYQWLVEHGYGKIKPKIEKDIVRTKALQDVELPANISEEGKKEYQEIKERLKEAHPFGIFWDIDDEGSLSIDREGFYNVANSLGFGLIEDELYRITGFIATKVSNREFYDIMKEYISEEDGDVYNTICNTYEAFIQKNGEFSISRLRLISDDLFLKDSKTVSYKFFKSSYIEISESRILEKSYNGFEFLIFSHQFKDREYREFEGGLYIDFLEKALGLSEKREYIQSVIGYLAHEYKDEATGYIILLAEQCPQPEDGGGSGKNLFCNLFKNTTTYKSKPGGQTKFDEKFMQTWDGERIFGISDVPKNFDFSFLKELSTGNGVIKKLFKNERVISEDKMPKFIIQTNYSYELTDGGLKRRIITLEFTDFFTISGGVDLYYKKSFPYDWGEDDWAGFDTFIAKSIQVFLKNDRKLYNKALTETGWQKQFEQSFGVTLYEFIKSNWFKEDELGNKGWLHSERSGFISNDDFNSDFDRFYDGQNIAKSYRPSSQKVNKALTEYARHYGWNYENAALKSINGLKIRGRQLTENAPF